MSQSDHPRALSLERFVSDPTRLLIVVMCLPLIDGVFAAVVLAGTLETVAGIVEVGLLIFSGSATIAVILAEMDETPRRQAQIVLGVGAVVVVGAAVQAALAPTVGTVLDLETFKRVAALVILSVAAATASARVGEYLPGPMAIVALGVVVSVSPSEASLAVQTDPELIARAIAAAGVGVGVSLAVAVTSPWLRGVVDIDRFRFGSAVALGVLALSIVGIIPGDAPVALAVLGVTLLAFNPAPEDSGGATDAASSPESGEQRTADQQPVPVADGSPPAETQGESSETGSNDTDRPPWM